VQAARGPLAARARGFTASRPTLVTTVLIAVNAAVFLLGTLGRGRADMWQTGVTRFEYDFGLNVVFLADGEWYRLLTSGVVHFGILHLGMNMLALWQLGRDLEGPLGPIRFALLYLASLLAGSAGVIVLQVVDLPLISQGGLHAGASGAVFGLLGATAVGLHQRGIPLSRSGIGTVLALNLGLTLLLGLSLGGHLGGLLGGAAAGAILLRPRSGRRPVTDLAGPVAVAAASVIIAVVATAVGT
jgi:membrane associated rhomboid family serine protease